MSLASLCSHTSKHIAMNQLCREFLYTKKRMSFERKIILKEQMQLWVMNHLTKNFCGFLFISIWDILLQASVRSSKTKTAFMTNKCVTFGVFSFIYHSFDCRSKNQLKIFYSWPKTKPNNIRKNFLTNPWLTLLTLNLLKVV